MTANAVHSDGARDAGAVVAASPPAELAARASQGGVGPGRRRGGPIDPRLVRRASATRWFLVSLVAVGGIGALLTLAQAWFLSRALGGVFATRDATPALAFALPLALVFAGRALLAWANQLLAHRAAASGKSQLRIDVMRARFDRPLDAGPTTGGLVTLTTQGLDALDGFYAKYLPQLVLAVVVPLVVGVAILTTDLLSAVIVALTLPLIPIFMALVGWSTEARTRRRFALQTRLARHFADLVEGLPTLQVFGRARAQAEGLRRTEAAHRTETMATLRISFLSALVLELLATLSVAIVAVTTGFRVLFGDLDLTAALFVLILAPEVYLPVRQVGVHYHDSADGMAAAEAAFGVIDPPVGSGSGAPASPAAPSVALAAASGSDAVPAQDRAPSLHSAELRSAAEPGPTPDHAPNGVRSGRLDRVSGASSDAAGAAPGAAAIGDRAESSVADGDAASLPPLVVVDGLGHSYPGESEPAVEDVTFGVRPGEFVVLTGPSGGGKTTVLNALIGFVRPTLGRVVIDGAALTPDAFPAWRRRIAYVGQNPGMISGTVGDNVRLGFPAASDADLRVALDAAGAPDLPLSQSVGDDGEGLSAGERRRVATARALLRIRLGGAELLLLDEPTAGLDADAEAALLGGLRALGVAAVVVSHRPAVIAEADAVVLIGASTSSVSRQLPEPVEGTTPDAGDLR